MGVATNEVSSIGPYITEKKPKPEPGVVDSETLEKWRDPERYGDKWGHGAEQKFTEVLTERIGVKKVDRDMVGEILDYYAISESTPEEDFDEGIDNFYYDPTLKAWFRIALTTVADPEIQRRKRQKADKQGNVLVQLRYNTLDRAHKGSERDIQLVAKDFTDSIKLYLEHQSPKAKAQPAESPSPSQ